MFVLIYKWLKNAVFSQASDHYPSRISSDTSILVLGGELDNSALDLASFRGYRILHGT
eukprot:COSAG06_NODE_6576_length_2873_cov_2.600216_1_plen_57_part_10